MSSLSLPLTILLSSFLIGILPVLVTADESALSASRQTVRGDSSVGSYAAESATCSEGWTCPPGMFCKGNRCTCGPHPHNTIACNGSWSSSVLTCFCVTLDESTNVTLLGACIHNCGSNWPEKEGVLYKSLPKRLDQLNSFCTDMNRSEALCGKCLSGYYPMAYSFSWACKQCPRPLLNWVKYIVAAYLPLTVFCVGIIFFKVNLASSRFYIVVMFCQTISMAPSSRVILTAFSTQRPIIFTALKLILSINGVWNLDFFRPFYTDFCLGIDTLSTLALDYAIAVYPLLLMAVTYALIVMYDKDYTVVTVMWRPFRSLFSRLRINRNIRTSVIDAFSTFFLLSNIKFLSVSFDLLLPTKIYRLHSDGYNSSLGLYYAPHVAYFGSYHCRFAVAAILVMVLFVVVPVLLLVLYPFAFFQRLLNQFQFRWYILHTFMDSFHCCYKDGTEPGTRDCRWFCAVYFLWRFLIFCVYGATLSIVFFNVAAALFAVLALLIMVVQPYKHSLASWNVTNALFSQLLALLCISISTTKVSAFYTSANFVFVFIAVALVLSPLVYFVFLAFHLIVKKGKKLLNLRRLGYQELLEPSKDEKLSDRIINPDMYPKENLACLVTPGPRQQSC